VGTRRCLQEFNPSVMRKTSLPESLTEKRKASKWFRESHLHLAGWGGVIGGSVHISEEIMGGGRVLRKKPLTESERRKWLLLGN